MAEDLAEQSSQARRLFARDLRLPLQFLIETGRLCRLLIDTRHLRRRGLLTSPRQCAEHDRRKNHQELTSFCGVEAGGALHFLSDVVGVPTEHPAEDSAVR